MSGELLLFLFSISILFSLLCARGVSVAKAPLIVGYIIAGAIMGPAVLNLISKTQIAQLEIISVITLSFIGFGIGSELKFKELNKLGRSILFIVIFEASMAFLLVGIFTALLLKSIPLGLIYGALACATAPAGTVEVIRQYRARGTLTTTLYAVMGLDDIYALLVYTLISPLAIIAIVGKQAAHTSVLAALGHAGLEILLAIAIGVLVGFLLVKIVKIIHDRVTVLLFSLGMILINCWLSEKLHISPILLNMSAGIVAVNYNAMSAGKIFKALGNWSPPIYVWFFVLVGTRLDFQLIINYAPLVIIYILSRSAGKWSGALLGGKLGKASAKVQQYLGFTLLSQAGVAVGLALAASKSLEKIGLQHEAIQVMSVITATTFIVMLVGPILAKVGLQKAGEIRVPD